MIESEKDVKAMTRRERRAYAELLVKDDLNWKRRQYEVSGLKLPEYQVVVVSLQRIVGLAISVFVIVAAMSLMIWAVMPNPSDVPLWLAIWCAVMIVLLFAWFFM